MPQSSATSPPCVVILTNLLANTVHTPAARAVVSVLRVPTRPWPLLLPCGPAKRGSATVPRPVDDHDPWLMTGPASRLTFATACSTVSCAVTRARDGAARRLWVVDCRVSARAMWRVGAAG